MLEEANNRLSDQIKEIKAAYGKKEDDLFDKIKDLKVPDVWKIKHGLQERQGKRSVNTFCQTGDRVWFAEG